MRINRRYYFMIVTAVVVLAGCNKTPDTLFKKVNSRQSKISFKNTLLETDEFNVIKYTYFYNGGGVAIGDVNNDGKPDIYLTGNMVASHLYINQGDFRFENIAKKAGVEAAGLWNTGVAMADVNDDGWLDIYVCRSAAKSANARRNLLFINDGVDENGDVRFTESGAKYGLNDPSYSTQATFFDFDRDGDLDMYLLNHSVPEFANLTADVEHLKNQPGSHFSDKLYVNDNGQFKDISEKAGLINNVLGFGLGIAVSDFNQDGWPDVYVSNDFHEEDYLYINQQDGTFKEDLRSRMDYTSLFSMGSDAGDVNNDGKMDLLTLDMLPQDNYRIKLTSGADNYNKYHLLLDRNFYKQNMRNMLQVNQGNGRFEELGQMAGISSSDWSWSALMSDYDLDGWSDIFVSNGYTRDYTNMDFLTYAVHFKMENPEVREEEIPLDQLISHMPEISVANKMYKNNQGLRFEDVSSQWGFTEPALSNGAAYGDLDGDGDLDLVINNVNEQAAIYSNQARDKGKGHFIGIKPLNSRQSQPAVGAEVTLYVDDLTMVRDLYTSRGFQSAVQPVVHFGLGDHKKVDSLIVLWPEGDRELFLVDEIDQYYNLVKGSGTAIRDNPVVSDISQTIFTQDSIISYTHQEDNFNDFDVQGLLLRNYSRMGPSLSIGDYNGDGYKDIVVGGGPGQSTTFFTGQADGAFSKPIIESTFQDDSGFEDVASVMADLDQDGDQDLIIASGGNNYPAGNDHYTLRFYENSGNGKYIRNTDFPEVIRSASCLVTGDFDGDDRIDVFLGSAYKAQQYPLSAGNVIIWNKGDGNWDVDEDIPFKDFICMDAVWKDIDSDGLSELVLGGEWEPIQMWNYSNAGWTLSGRSDQKGLVTSLKVVNLDDDPEMEIIIGNWGENSHLEASVNHPLVLYYGDFDDNGTVDPILSYDVGGQTYPFVSRDDLTGQLPFLKKFFTSYHDYGLMSMEELLTHLPDYKTDSVQTLSSYILDFNDGRWDPIVLPPAAQVSPVFAIETMDIDQDGDYDIILAGNSRYNRVKIGEMEANHGVLLENQGGLKFKSISPLRSGLDLSGEVRSVLSYKANEGEYVLFGINEARIATYRLHGLVPVQ